MTLADMSPGQTAVIQSIRGEDETIFRLSELGLVEGQPVSFVRAAPLGDPIEIRIMHYELCLRRSEASVIAVEPLHDPV